MGGGGKKGRNAPRATDLEYKYTEIKIFRKLLYHTVKKYIPYVLTILTILIVLSTVYQRFLFLRMILAAYVDVSTRVISRGPFLSKIRETF